MGTPFSMRLRRAASVLLCGAVATVGVLVTAPVATGSPSGHDWRVWVGNESKNMAIQGMRFLPGQVWVDQGDTVTWLANAAEIHTVTFFKGGVKEKSVPPFDPTNAKQTMRTGGGVYHPSKYYNSGILTTSDSVGVFPTIPVYHSYTLKFPRVGDYTYYCLVHGTLMKGTVHVRRAGTPYPHTQAEYDLRAAAHARALIADGRSLIRSTRAEATRHHVFAGAQDNKVMIMRFLRHTVRIKAGTTVTFDNINVLVPHTVTFGREQKGPKLLAPYGDPTHFRGGRLSSGIIEPGAKFAVTFKKAGSYRYICILHDEMGMVGRVIVH